MFRDQLGAADDDGDGNRDPIGAKGRLAGWPSHESDLTPRIPGDPGSGQVTPRGAAQVGPRSIGRGRSFRGSHFRRQASFSVSKESALTQSEAIILGSSRYVGGWVSCTSPTLSHTCAHQARRRDQRCGLRGSKPSGSETLRLEKSQNNQRRDIERGAYTQQSEPPLCGQILLQLARKFFRPVLLPLVGEVPIRNVGCVREWDSRFDIRHKRAVDTPIDIGPGAYPRCARDTSRSESMERFSFWRI